MSQHTEGWRRSAHRRLPRLCAGICAGPCCEWAGVVLAAVGFESLGVSGIMIRVSSALPQLLMLVQGPAMPVSHQSVMVVLF